MTVSIFFSNKYLSIQHNLISTQPRSLIKLQVIVLDRYKINEKPEESKLSKMPVVAHLLTIFE